MNEGVNNAKLYVTTEQQQEALGLPGVATAYDPHDFVKLAGRAQLAHYMHNERAQAQSRRERIPYQAQAGIAESVFVGVLRKVVDLGDSYDEAIQEPVVPEPHDSGAEAPQAMPEIFSPMLLEHFSMAAARRIEEVRAIQRSEEAYAQPTATDQIF